MARVVEGRTLRGDLRALAPWLVVTVALWAGVVALRQTRTAPAPQRPPWEHSFLELSPADQLRYRLVREGILEAENRRSGTETWPEPEVLAVEGVPPFEATDLEWTLRRHGIYVNYVGVPATGRPGLRWLVLFIEPEAVAFDGQAPAPPVDEEHHTLPDGTVLHVTVWTTPNQGLVPCEVLAFPVAEGWVQRVGRL